MRQAPMLRLLLIGSLLAALALSGCGSSSSSRNLVPFQPDYGSFTATPTISSTRGAIQGVVLDSSNVPAPGATVTVNNARRSASPYFSVTAGPAGEYSIGNMEPGTYTLTASLPGVGEVAPQEVTVQAAGVTTVPPVRLDGSQPLMGRVVGKVTAEGGQAVEGAVVQVAHGTHVGHAMTTATGDFTIGGLSAGTYEASVTKAGFQLASQQVTVAAGQDAVLNVTLQPMGSRVYVGSSACKSCHGTLYDEYQKSGHPYKISKVDGQPPSLPFSSVPLTPAGYSWADITYLIGGYGWKARFVDRQGYIITGNAVQYNLANQKWAAYEAAKSPGTKPYTCGACHTTGWQATGAAGPHQDNLPGMHGTFSEPGITCEACHGPGSNHVITRSAADIEVDRSSEACGSCHFRDSQHRIAAKVSNGKGFIEHHEQYDELISAKHAALKCVDCHNPHRSTINKQGGVTRTCESCHAAQAAKKKHGSFIGGPTCVDCHMPKATKSATNTNVYQADLHTHIFKIKTDAVDQSDMWYTEGTGTFAQGHVTLDFACYGCHKDVNGVGGSASVKTLGELSMKARGMHQ